MSVKLPGWISRTTARCNLISLGSTTKTGSRRLPLGFQSQRQASVSGSSRTCEYGEESAVIIPARMESTRFPGKPLATVGGMPMILRTIQRAEQATRIGRVVVATDSAEIQKVVQAHGKEAVMTGKCASGTDRVAEAAKTLPQRYGVVVNVQGDEPLVSPEHIDLLVQYLQSSAEESMATIATPIHDEAEFHNPNVVKTVLDAQGYALLFSRAPIPHSSAGFSSLLRRRAADFAGPLRHVGLYGFHRPLLHRWPSLPPSPLHATEDLEQLKALYQRIKIKVVVVDSCAPDVNVPEDIQRVEAYLANTQVCAPR